MSCEPHDTDNISADSLNTGSEATISPAVVTRASEPSDRKYCFFQPSSTSTPMSRTSGLKQRHKNKTPTLKKWPQNKSSTARQLPLNMTSTPKPLPHTSGVKSSALKSIGNTINSAKVAAEVVAINPVVARLRNDTSGPTVMATKRLRGRPRKQDSVDQKLVPNKRLKTAQTGDNGRQAMVTTRSASNTSNKENQSHESVEKDVFKMPYKTRSQTHGNQELSSMVKKIEVPLHVWTNPLLQKSKSVNELKPQLKRSNDPIIEINDTLFQNMIDRVVPEMDVEEGVKEMMIDVCDDFIINTMSLAAKIAHNRSAGRLDVRDVGLALDKRYNMQFPEFNTGIDKKATKSQTRLPII